MKIWQMILPALIALVVVAVLAGLCSEEGGARTITVDDDGKGDYATIQAAIDNATAGDTIRVYEGTYHENVVVNKTLTLIGNGSGRTTIDGGGSGDVVKITADWCNMSGFTVTGSGILRSGLDVESNNNQIVRNIFKNNSWEGVSLASSESNTVANNSIWNNALGIHLYLSTSNIVVNNVIRNNFWDGGMWIHISDFNTIENNTIQNNSWGIHTTYSSSNIIVNNTILNTNSYGIDTYNSNSNTIANNIIKESKRYGIYLDENSDSNLIASNTILNNSHEGIYLSGSSSNIIANNTIRNNTNCGIHLDDSPSNTMTNNTISGNRVGINVTRYSENNTAHYNRIFNNTRRGARTYHYTCRLDARFNYWGSDSGPRQPWANPKGKGDYITDYVTFRPWLNADGTVNPSPFPSEEDNDQHSALLETCVGIFIVFSPVVVIVMVSETHRFIACRFIIRFYPRSKKERFRDGITQKNTRKDIWLYIKEQPGIRLSALKEKTSAGYLELVYHLTLLERDGYIWSGGTGTKRGFWRKRNSPDLYPDTGS